MPGWFTSRFYPGISYKTLERLSPEEARQRRLFAELGRQRKELEVRSARLSPANEFHRKKLEEFESKLKNALEARRRNVERIRSKGDFRRLKTARLLLLQLTQRRDALRQRAELERRASLQQASAVNRRSYLPRGFSVNPRTVFGTEAWTAVSQGSRRYFKSPLLAIPCVDRLVRREVMFAKKHAGRAYRVPHKHNPFSHIGC